VERIHILLCYRNIHYIHMVTQKEARVLVGHGRNKRGKGGERYKVSVL
jgi:hypothetical protein